MKLQPLLTEYLIEHGTLPLSGIGCLSIEHKTATFFDNELSLLPPIDSIVFSSTPPTIENEQQELVDFIRSRLNISDQQTSVLLKEESDLQGAFAQNETFNWATFGSFQKAANGIILFSQADTLNNYLPAIALTPIKRQPEAELIEQVEQKIMEEPVYEFAALEKKDNWWIWAIAIFFISVLLILIRYYTIF